MSAIESSAFLSSSVTQYDCAKYEKLIAQDFERHQDFVDIDVFMERVLHIPGNWEELWGRTVGQIKRDPGFSMTLWEYTRLCGTRGVPEQKFYKHLVDMTNNILNTYEPSDGAKPQIPLRYPRNDPGNDRCGKVKDPSPEPPAVHRKSLSHLYLDEHKEKQLQPSNMMWAQPLQVLEVKPGDNTLVDGSCMPRLKLKVNGQDPQENHIHAFTPSRFRKKAPPDIYLYGVASALAPAHSRKRPADELSESSRKAVKVDHRSTPGGQPPEMKPARPQMDETKQQEDIYIQVGRYLLEQFFIPTFRSHATVGLVDRGQIQFYHANHSVILVSSAINFTMEGLDKFIAIVIAFSRLFLRDNGILRHGQLFRDNRKLATPEVPRGAVIMQEGNKLVFGGDKRTKQFTLTYGEVISHQPLLAGRATIMLHVESSSLWKELNLVVKISWPGSDRVAENEFLAKAVETAKSSPDDNWALKHLPRVLFAQDSDSTDEKVVSLFDNAEPIDENYTYIYERRTLRIIVQERLYPLETLTDVREIAQVLLDAACVHRWLYVRAGILHQDFSISNIMCRIVKEGVNERKVYGVLTDFDLASWKKTKTSQQKAGTLPFTASGLLDQSDALHLYRHDLESLFYVMLILVTHYEIQPPTNGEGGGLRTRQGLKELPYQGWFNQESCKTLACLKYCFFTRYTNLNLSPDFEDFRGWLKDLYYSFMQGFRSKVDYGDKLERSRWCKDEGSGDEAMPTFDDETLGGHVHYSALINPVRKLKGGLEGLIIRYDPTLQTSVGPAGTDH